MKIIYNTFNLKELVRANYCPENLVFQHSNWIRLTDDELNVIVFAITSGKCKKNFKILLSSNNLSDDAFRKIINALLIGNAPNGLALDFSSNAITDITIGNLITVLQSGKCPPDLAIDLSNNKLTDLAIKQVENMLQTSTSIPTGLRIFGLGNRVENLCEERINFIPDFLTRADHALSRLSENIVGFFSMRYQNQNPSCNDALGCGKKTLVKMWDLFT